MSGQEVAEGGTTKERAQVPDLLVGLGNAGKQIVYEFMDSEWILEEALEVRDDPGRPDLEAYVIDTDRNEQGQEDAVRVSSINDKIDSVARRVEGDERATDTELTYINPLDSIESKYTDKSGLISQTTVRDIASGLHAWWLEDSDEMLVDDYNEGVLRRRALSKALFHASNTGDNPLNPVLNAQADVAYMVVGLGGGTGSGMFLDVAKELEDRVDSLYLLGVTPATGEAERRRANAHAALSEIEYLARTGENNGPFDNIVLMPFGALGNRDNKSEKAEFDEAAAKVIMSHLSFESNDEQLLSPQYDLPRYAPFTVAVPQTLRYNIGSAETAKGEIDDFLEENIDALEPEHDLYTALGEYIIENFEGDVADKFKQARSGTPVDDEQFSLTSSVAGDLRQRFDRLYETLQEDIFEALDYEAAEDWRDQIEQGLDEAYDDEVGVEQDELVVVTATLQAENLRPPEERYPREDKNQQLDEFVRKELQAIRHRANLYRALSLIDDDPIVEGIVNAMEPGTSVKPAELRRKIGELTSRINELEDNCETTEDFIAKLEADDLLEDKKAAWKKEVEPSLESLIAIEQDGDELSELLTQLETEIGSAVQEIESKNRSQHLAESRRDELFQFDQFDELNEGLAEIDEAGIDEDAIRRSVDALREAHRVRLEAEEGQEGWAWVLSNVPILSSLVDDGQDELRIQYDEALDQVDDDLFDYQDDFGKQFYCKFTAAGQFENKADAVEAKRQERIEDVVEAFRRQLRDLPIDHEQFEDEVRTDWKGELPDPRWPGDASEHVERLETRLEGLNDASAGALVDELTRSEAGGGFGDGGPGLVHEGLHQAIVGPAESLLETLETERDEKRTTLGRYQSLETILENEGSAFTETGPKRVDVDFKRNMSDGNYVKNDDTEDPDRLLNQDDLVSADLHVQDEELIGNRLRGFAENVVGLDERLPLQEGIPKIEPRVVPDGEEVDQDTRYEHRVITVFGGRAFAKRGPERYDPDDEIQDTLRNGLAMKSSDEGYQQNVLPFGSAWDTSLVTFVGGVFLDNLRPVRNSTEGYHASYVSQRDDLVKDIRVRHTHGLDGLDASMTPDPGEGAFVVRDPLIDMEDPAELNEFVNADQQSRRSFFEERTDVETFESTVDLGNTN